MNAALIGTILGLLERYGPSVAKAAVDLFQKKNPTPADFNAVFDAAEKLDYDRAISEAEGRAKT